jgi:hypothetical protein
MKIQLIITAITAITVLLISLLSGLSLSNTTTPDNRQKNTIWIQTYGMVIIQNRIHTISPHMDTFHQYKSHICFKYNVSDITYIKCCNGFFLPIKYKNVTIYINSNDPYDAYIDTKYRYIFGPIITFITIFVIYFFNTIDRLPKIQFRSPIVFVFK